MCHEYLLCWSGPLPQLNDDLKAIEVKHEVTAGSVGDLTETLAVLSDELQELQEKMESKGDTVRGLIYYLHSALCLSHPSLCLRRN